MWLCNLLPSKLRLGRERRRHGCHCCWLGRPLTRLLRRHLLLILRGLSACWRAPSLRLLLLRPDARWLMLRPGCSLLPLLLWLSILLLLPRARLLRRRVVARLPLLVGQHCARYVARAPLGVLDKCQRALFFS